MTIINQWRISHSARCSNFTDRQQNQTTFFLYSFVEKFLLAILFLPSTVVRLKVPEFISTLFLTVSIISFLQGGGGEAGQLWMLPQRKCLCWALKNEKGRFTYKEAHVRFSFFSRGENAKS